MAPIHLLLIEDSPGDVLLIREALRHGPVPVEVTIAEDGAQALALLNDGLQPDLIILDLSIPRLDGYERRCCNRPRTAQSGARVAPTPGPTRRARCSTARETKDHLAVCPHPPDSPARSRAHFLPPMAPRRRR